MGVKIRPGKPDKKKWMSIEEAIKRVMDVTGCDRLEAAEKLAGHINDGQLGLKRFAVKAKLLGRDLPEAEARRRIAYDPESVFTTLADLAMHFRLTGAELLGELQAGRLIAHARDSQALFEIAMAKLDQRRQIDVRHLIVTGDAVRDWVENPQTPRHLLNKHKQN